MKCNIAKDLLPLYADNLVSEETRNEIEVHLQTCKKCAEFYQNGLRQIPFELVASNDDLADANKLKRVKKRLSKKMFRVILALSAIFVAAFIVMLSYISISHPVTKNDISLSTKVDNGYSYVILKVEAGKSISFDSKTEDVLDENNKVCGQKITLYNLQYKNTFSQNANVISWGSPANTKTQNIELFVELENDTLQISNNG